MEKVTVRMDDESRDAAFSASALLGVSRDEAVNLGVQLLAEFIAGRRGKVLIVELPNNNVREVHFH